MKHQKPPHAHEEHPFAAFAAPLNASLSDTFGKSASALGRTFATMQKESLRFLNQRVEENMKAVEEFGACRSLPDYFATQQRWFAGVTRAYAEEWQRCSELMSDMAREGAAEAAPEQDRPPRSEPH
ncbi:MAG: phasin family protein [Alphaproteobacteria bacterium]|nr:phasin family protein [Alphaproteobacteria bacterium]